MFKKRILKIKKDKDGNFFVIINRKKYILSDEEKLLIMK